MSKLNEELGMAFSGSLKLNSMPKPARKEANTKNDTKASKESTRRGAFKKPNKG
jgi:hypothetical protein